MHRKNKIIQLPSFSDYLQEEFEKDPNYAKEFANAFSKLLLAQTIRDLRKKKELTQKALAQMVGTDQPKVARIERGQITPKLDLLSRFANALGAYVKVEFVPLKTPKGKIS